MYWVNVNSGAWTDGHTEIRVGFTDEAKAEADRWSTPSEKMLDRCFWRLIYERWSEVQGDSVTFEVDLPMIQSLINRLPTAEADKLN